jgi:hypothetical protein
VFLLNSRQGLFAATLQSSGGKPLHPRGHPFSRSYGVNLPSSLTGDHASTLGRLPQATCVGFRYGHRHDMGGEAFLASVGSASSA